MNGSRSVRSFRCADKLWRALEDEADERGVTVDTVVTEALWSHLREAPEFSTATNVRSRMDGTSVSSARTDPPASEPLRQRISAEHQQRQQADDRARVVSNPKLARPVRDLSRARSSVHDSEPTVDNLQIVRDEEGRIVDPETGKAIDVSVPDDVELPEEALAPVERPALGIYFSGMHYPVTSEKFIIGRASTGTDLQIRDANVSRKHAAVIFHDGGWFIHDLQSTNGVEFKGRHIRTRRIEHNDRFLICDYELIFELED